jgi:N utilization substance protein A
MKIDVALIKTIEQETGVQATTIIESIEVAINQAYLKTPGAKPYSRTELDQKTGKLHIYAKDALTLDEVGNAATFTPEEEIDFDKELKGFEHTASSAARNEIKKRLKDAQDGYIFEEYKNKEKQLINGMVQQIVNRDGELSENVKIKINKNFEAFLPSGEQTPGEVYNHGDYLKAYIISVERGFRGPDITVSRSHPGLIRRLFETVVPEIGEKIIQIHGVAREAGSRTKISVSSNDKNVNPVASLIGELGKRVRAVVEELQGEKIDIVEYSDDPATYVKNALSPATIDAVNVIDEENNVAEVITAPDQTTLAIGIDGQNIRLASRLTGWKLDVKTD